MVREGLAADAVAGIVPAFVASPASTAEAAALLRAASAHGLAVVPRGAGTGFGWGLPGSRCDLVVDMQAMDQVLEHAAGDLVARVQAGVTLGQLGSVLGLAGQQLALDAPPEATVGGVVATGTAGPRRFRYGAPRDLLIGITAVRADGVVAHSGGKVVKNVAGYDIGKLLAGSQGTLALITEATFRLHPVPPSVAWVTAEFGPADLPAAAAAVAAAAGSALVPSAVELDWSGSVLRMGVLLEGTAGGVANRVKQMCALIADSGVVGWLGWLADGGGRGRAVPVVGPGTCVGRARGGGAGDVLGVRAGRGARCDRGVRLGRGSAARGRRPGRGRDALRLPRSGDRARPLRLGSWRRCGSGWQARAAAWRCWPLPLRCSRRRRPTGMSLGPP